MQNEQTFVGVVHEWIDVFARHNIRDFKQLMDREQLSPSQANALFRLHYRGSCGISAIGEHLGVTDAAASQLIDRMVQRGFIRREENKEDRRVKTLELTADGAAIIEKTLELRREWLRRLTDSLTPEQQAAIVNALKYLIDAAHQIEPEEETELSR